MSKRWTDKDVEDLKRLAQRYPAHEIAEMLDRSVGGVAFKAYQLKLPLRVRSSLRTPSSTPVTALRGRA
jgi:hypothetical protein